MHPGSSEHSRLCEPGERTRQRYLLPVISAAKSGQRPEVAGAAGGVMSGMHNKVLTSKLCLRTLCREDYCSFSLRDEMHREPQVPWPAQE